MSRDGSPSLINVDRLFILPARSIAPAISQTWILPSPLSRTQPGAILASLAAAEAPVTKLAKPFAISPPAISKHPKILECAGLISQARERTAASAPAGSQAVTVDYPSKEVRDIVLQSGIEQGAAETYDKLAELFAFFETQTKEQRVS